MAAFWKVLLGGLILSVAAAAALYVIGWVAERSADDEGGS